MRERPAETRDGRRIVLSANVGLLNDLRLIEQNDLIVVGREVFMHAVQAEYWNQIRSGILPEGSPVTSSA